MIKAIDQIPKPYKAPGEEMPEFLDFERVVNLQKELMEMDK